MPTFEDVIRHLPPPIDRQRWELEAALSEGDVFELEVTEQLQKLRYKALLRDVSECELEQIGELLEELMRVHRTLLDRDIPL